MRDVTIYAKTLKEYCAKKPRKNSRDPLTIHVMGKISDFMLGKSMPVKYGDPGNPILTVQINAVEIPNVLVDLGAAINVITVEAMHTLGLRNLKHTPTVCFIENISKIAHPLFQLLTKDADFVWTDDYEVAFVKIKELICRALILQGQDWTLPFHIHVDASQKVVGAVLGQQVDKVPYAVYYVSENLVHVELNYTMTEKEFLVVIYAINKFRHYITDYPTFVYTGQATVNYLMNKLITLGRITR
eukprot:PITA_27631